MCYRVCAFCLPGMKISQELVLERPAAIPKTLPSVQVTLDLPCRLAPLGLTVRRGAAGGPCSPTTPGGRSAGRLCAVRASFQRCG